MEQAPPDPSRSNLYLENAVGFSVLFGGGQYSPPQPYEPAKRSRGQFSGYSWLRRTCRPDFTSPPANCQSRCLPAAPPPLPAISKSVVIWCVSL